MNTANTPPPSFEMYNNVLMELTAFDCIRSSSSDIRGNYLYLSKYGKTITHKIMEGCIYSNLKPKQTFEGSYR